MCDERREQVKHSLRSQFEQTLDGRVDRYLAVNHQGIIGKHHFALASTECIDLFRDGYFTSCIMIAQAVAEGIVTFVGRRNQMVPTEKETKQAFAVRMQEKALVSQNLVEAFDRICRSHRNDFHHMNPPVAAVDLEATAARNISDLAFIEREIFAIQFAPKGTVLPLKPAYWDQNDDGSVPVFLRLG